MSGGALHSWDLTPKEAVALQWRLRVAVATEDRIDAVRHVAGVDVGFEQDGTVTRAAVAVLRIPDLTLVDRAVARRAARFPYMPGLLSFREAPAVIDAFSALAICPDLILYDGQGLAHPRRFGIASHVGLWLDLPTIGVAKTRLTGEHGRVPAAKGKWVALRDGGEVIGAVLRTRAFVRPIYVSIGHRVSLDTAVSWVMACVTRFRLPETTRCAHRLASDRSPE